MSESTLLHSTDAYHSECCQGDGNVTRTKVKEKTIKRIFEGLDQLTDGDVYVTLRPLDNSSLAPLMCGTNFKHPTATMSLEPLPIFHIQFISLVINNQIPLTWAELQQPVFET